MIKLCLVEDDREIRDSLSLIFNRTHGYSCAYSFERAEDLIKKFEKIDVDLILMDISLPGLNGIDAVKKIKQSKKKVEILMLTVHQDDKLVFDALCAGATGYLVKNTPPKKILEAIDEALEGGAPMSTNIARMVVKSFQREANTLLTSREMDVLSQLCEGKSYKLIADALFISQDTVRSHIKSIYRKLEVNSNAEAVAMALKNKII